MNDLVNTATKIAEDGKTGTPKKGDSRRFVSIITTDEAFEKDEFGIEGFKQNKLIFKALNALEVGKEFKYSHLDLAIKRVK